MPKHLSIRVPWHDNGWNGTVCQHPEYNQACRALRPIALGKNDTLECTRSGKPLSIIDGYRPPCLDESGAFMAEKRIDTLPMEHPYAYDKRYSHIASTPYKISPYSFTTRPYAWTLRKNANEITEKKLYNTHHDASIEVDLGSCNWISNGINQKNIFDYFYRDIAPNISHQQDELCISAITYAELIFGAQKKNSNRIFNRIEQFMCLVSVTAFDKTAAYEYAVINQQLTANGTPIGTMDTMIAACAKSSGAILVTNNGKHFTRILGLAVENWAF
jgi:predicted nucleic acid-binding protein